MEKVDAASADRPVDDFSRHEVLHVAWMVQDMIDRYLAQHTAVEANPEWKRLADELVAKACEFYQRIGADTLDHREHAADMAAVEANRAYEAEVGWEAARKTYLTADESRAALERMDEAEVDQSDPNRGRFDPERVGKPNPKDK